VYEKYYVQKIILMKSKENFLVIGSNSFSGSHFVNYLLSKGHKTIGVSRSKEIREIFLPYKKNINYKLFSFYKIDLNNDRDVKKLLNIIKKFNIKYIVNFAAQGMVAQSWLYPLDWYRTNILGLINFTNQILHNKNIKKFVQVSTPEVYGNIEGSTKESANYNPSTPYAISKACYDFHLMALFKSFKFPVVFTRAANVFGPGQGLYRIIPKSIIMAIQKKKIKLHGGGISSRSFVFITDIADATYKICLRSKIGEIYHISTNRLISIKNLVKKIFKINNLGYTKYVIHTQERTGKDKVYRLDSKKLRKKLKWKPAVSLEKGILETQKWVENNIDLIKKLPLNYEHKK